MRLNGTNFGQNQKVEFKKSVKLYFQTHSLKCTLKTANLPPSSCLDS